MSRPQLTPSSPPLRVGVLYISPVQFLDAAALDIFGMLTKEYLQACNLPSPLLALGISVTIHHITASSIDTPISLTSNTTLHPTASLTSPAVQPGQLDVLLIPGPDPSSIPSSETQSFIRAHAAIPTCDILTICTGIFPAGHSGILKDRTCTGPRGLLSKLRSDFPGAKFQEKRWTRDGNLWTSGLTTLTSPFPFFTPCLVFQYQTQC